MRAYRVVTCFSERKEFKSLCRVIFLLLFPMIEFSSFLSSALLALALGGLIGLERERSGSTNLGLRTFAIVSFFGLVASVIGTSFSGFASALVVGLGFFGALALSFLHYYFRVTRQSGKESIGITTALAVPFTYLLGVLVGMGYNFEAVASAIAIAFLLVEKQKVHAAVKSVSIVELVDGLIFAIIAFVIYPLIPANPQVFLGYAVDLQLAWKIVVVGSLLSFGAHLLTKYLHAKGALLAAFFGGAVSSIGVVYLFIHHVVRNPPVVRLALVASSAGAYFADLLFLGFVAPHLFAPAGYPIIAAALVLLGLTFLYRRDADLGKVIFSKPLSLAFVAELAVLFFLVKFLADVLTAYFGETGLLISSLIGGAASSSAVFASVIALFSQGAINVKQASLSMLLGLVGSLGVKTFLVGHKLKWNEPAKLLLPAVASLLVGFAVYLFLV